MREGRLNKRLPGIALSGFGSEPDVTSSTEKQVSLTSDEADYFER